MEFLTPTEFENYKVVVSEGLAKAFVEVSKEKILPSEICNMDNYFKYNYIPELDSLDALTFEKLLSWMLSVGYAIEMKPLKYIKLDSPQLTEEEKYLNYDIEVNQYFLGNKIQEKSFLTKFNKKQVEAFLDHEERRDMWIIEEVEDDECNE